MISLTMLDRRIRSIEDIKAFNNVKGSEYKLINEIGYFADNIERFCDLRKLQTGKLTNIVDNTDACFEYNGIAKFRYFLPVYALKSNSKSELDSGYRKFANVLDVGEFGGLVGKVLTIREKKYPKNIIQCFCTRIDYDLETLELKKIWLGSYAYEPKSVFENFEIKLKDTWCPFGIREK